MFTSRTARVAPPLRRCGRARPPNSAQARCGGSPLLRQGPPAGHGGTIMHPCHSPPIYIDTRNAQKVASILHFSKTFSCRGEMRMKSKRKRTAACRDDWAKADRNRAAVRREGWEKQVESGQHTARKQGRSGCWARAPQSAAGGPLRPPPVLVSCRLIPFRHDPLAAFPPRRARRETNRQPLEEAR